MDTSTIWNKYSGPVKGFILKKVKDEEVANDLLQEVFLRVHTKKKHLRKEEALDSWIYKIANHLVMDHFRRSSFTSEIPEIAIGPVDEDYDPSHCLKPLIKELPEHYSKALTLSEIEGLRQAEVARVLDISVSGAKSRIQRGIKLLQKAFIDCCNYTLNDEGYLVGETESTPDCKVCS